jgi:hypothetical protein
MTKRNRQFAASLGAYGVLAILATTTLTGKIRTAVLILMAALALLTCVTRWRERLEEEDAKKDE